MTTIANVYVQQLVEGFLRRLEDPLRQMGFMGSPFLMLSSGGIATVDTAVEHPIRLLESGPAGVALVAADRGAEHGQPDQLSFNMGGTPAKICVIAAGRPQITYEMEVKENTGSKMVLGSH